MGIYYYLKDYISNQLLTNIAIIKVLKHYMRDEIAR